MNRLYIYLLKKRLKKSKKKLNNRFLKLKKKCKCILNENYKLIGTRKLKTFSSTNVWQMTDCEYGDWKRNLINHFWHNL